MVHNGSGGLLHEENVEAERGVNCEHMQTLVTKKFQRHWEWQEDRRTDLQPGFYRYNMAFMASLDVKTAFDVAKLSVVSRILTLTGVHGHLTADLLAEMQDVRGPCASKMARQSSGTQGASAKVAWCSGAVGTHGQVRAVESRRNMDSKGLEVTLWVDNTTMNTFCVA